jgi:hypothetical protein
MSTYTIGMLPLHPAPKKRKKTVTRWAVYNVVNETLASRVHKTKRVAKDYVFTKQHVIIPIEVPKTKAEA